MKPSAWRQAAGGHGVPRSHPWCPVRYSWSGRQVQKEVIQVQDMPERGEWIQPMIPWLQTLLRSERAGECSLLPVPRRLEDVQLLIAAARLHG